MMKSIAICLIAVLVSAVPLRASQSIVSVSHLREAVAQHAAEEQAQRDRVVQFLHGSEARDVAGRFGLDLTRAEAAVASLSGEELAAVAARVPAPAADLAGGQMSRNHYMLIGAAVVVLLLVLLLSGDDDEDDLVDGDFGQT